MRPSLILSLLGGGLIGLLLGNQVVTSQEEILPTPEQEELGRFQIAGHSTYPPLLIDSETGASWILMSASDGEESRWVWEPIEMGPVSPGPSHSNGRDIARFPAVPRPSHRPVTFTKPPGFSW